MTVGIRPCLKNYYGQNGITSSSVGSGVLVKTQTVINNDLMRGGDDKVIGARKTISLGAENPLNRLGISELQIHRSKGKEPMVLFRAPINDGKRQTIGFLQKTERNKMANFIKVLKEFKESGVQPNFELLEKLLKRIH